MPPKAAAAAGDSPFTPRETNLLSYAMQCMEGEPKIDMQKFSKMAGFTNKGSAANAWRSIRAKLASTAAQGQAKGDSGAADDSADATPAAKTPASRKRGKKVKDEDEDEETPIKKARTGGKGKKAVKQEMSDEDAPGSTDDETHADEGAVVKNEIMAGDD